MKEEHFNEGDEIFNLKDTVNAVLFLVQGTIDLVLYCIMG